MATITCVNCYQKGANTVDTTHDKVGVYFFLLFTMDIEGRLVLKKLIYDEVSL